MKKLVTLLFLIGICFLAEAINSVKTPQLTIGFLQNKGQILNPNGQVNKEVLFHLNSEHAAVQLRENGFSYTFFEADNGTQAQRVDIDFVGANTDALKEMHDKNEGEIIYRGKQNISEEIRLNSYTKVLYSNIYPNIDVEFLSFNENGQQAFKYNFILHPGANSNLIQLKFNGAKSTRINKNGNIVFKTCFGKMEERVPYSYELKSAGDIGNTVVAKFKQLGSNLFGFAIGKYDESKTLVIDPLLWSTYYGGTSAEQNGGMVVDSSGNIYIAGRTASKNNIASPVSYQPILGGASGYDGFIAKFGGGGGAMLWATYFGGTGTDEIDELALDKDQNLILTGNTSSAAGIATLGAFQSTLNGSVNGFVAKFTPAGNIVWSTYYGGTGTIGFYGINVDIKGDINVVGSSSSTDVLNYPNIHQSSNAGLTDILLVKLNVNGQVKWATYYGGTLNDNAYGLCSDNNCNLYVTGNTFSTSGLSTMGAYQFASGGGSDTYMAKFDTLGRLTYGTFYGGSASDYGSEMTMDNEGKLIIVGYTSSTSNIATNGAFQTLKNGTGYDGFILKLDTAGGIIWGSYYGDIGTENLYNVTVDPSNNIYFCGGTTSAANMATSGSYQSSIWGSGDAFFGCFDKNGARQWCSYFGGPSGSEGIKGIVFDKLGNLHCYGVTNSDTGIATPWQWQNNRQGNTEMFLFKYYVGLPVVELPIGNNTISSSQGLCGVGAAQDLTGTFPSGGDGMFNYQWLFSNSGLPGTYVSAAGANTNDSYSPGTVTVNSYYRRVVFSGTKSDTSNQVSIIVSGSLSNGFTINKKIQCLKDNQFICTDTTTVSAGILSYNWDFGNGKTSSNQIDTARYAPSVENLYHIRLVTTLDGGCSDTAEQTVIVINNPTQKSILGKDTVMKGTTEIYTVPNTNGSTYNWMFSNGTGRSTNASISIKWTQMGDVNVQVQESNGGGCKGDTASFHVFVKQPTGQEELVASAVQIYPNPSEGVFYIELGSNQLVQLEISNMTGQIIFQKMINGQATFDLTDEAAGIYFLRLQTENGSTLNQKINLVK